MARSLTRAMIQRNADYLIAEKAVDWAKRRLLKSERLKRMLRREKV